jgi:outer membrane scaffolding protein for murein synthesis (MipA/OmpV family)
MPNDSIKTASHRKTFVAAALLLCVALSAPAEDRWSFSLGGGALASNVYLGADEFYVAPLPFFRAAYRTGKIEFFASVLDGLGLQYLDMGHHLFATAGVNLGSKRDSETYNALLIPIDHSARTKRLLAGAATAWNPAYAFCLLGWISPVGILGGALYYQPTIVSGESDQLFHAYVPSILYLAPVQLSKRLGITVLVSLDFMDQNFAEAWYSVEKATGGLEAFDAGSGLRDVQFIFQARYKLTERVGANFLAGSQYLLGDAADSPYTTSPYQLKAGLYLSYTW